MRKIRALALYKENSGCDYHRVRLPFEYAAEYVDNTAFMEARGDVGKLFEAAEIVVFNRQSPLDIDIYALRERYGFKIALDLDDYWRLYFGHYLSDHYARNDLPAKMVENIRRADVVTVTTERLADMVRPYNANVHVIPNALPYGDGQFKCFDRLPSEKFRFIYSGGRSHGRDVLRLENGIKRLAANPGEIEICLAGYQEGDSPVWEKMERVFTANGALNGNYCRIANAPVNSYMYCYRAADASLVPLEPNTFNSCKSNLKLLEAAAMKLPVIADHVAPYSDCPDAPVLFVKKRDDWFKYMKYLSGNREKAADLGEELHRWAVSNYKLQHWNISRFELYRKIVG